MFVLYIIPWWELPHVHYTDKLSDIDTLLTALKGVIWILDITLIKYLDITIYT